ncbi:MAG: UDP-N-acetylglucosamine 2-epimerase [Candidatus Margulisiibacteriota bacterium]
MRKICVVTGSRSEYGLLKPVIEKISKEKNLRLQLAVCGMHFSRKHGLTYRIVEKDFPKHVVRAPFVMKGDSGFDMSMAVGEGIKQFSGLFKRIKPDILLVLGDRMEILSAATAALYMNIPIAHMHGGDRGFGCVDNQVRDAVTKMSSLHFAATKKSAKRIIKMGEEPERVFVTGAPGLDAIKHSKLLSKPELFNKYGLDAHQPLLIALQHPVTTETGSARGQMKETMDALTTVGLQTIVLYPNNDAGGRQMIDVINSYKGKEIFKIFTNVERTDYLSMLKHANALVGNSSSGIIETPLFGIPVVNIGSRQKGRERSTNIIDAGSRKALIVRAIAKALRDRAFISLAKKCKNPYGDGRAAQRAVKILKDIKLDKKLLQKEIDR